MVEDGDGWCPGEPGSPAGFYSAHWACTNPSKDGEWAVVYMLEVETVTAGGERVVLRAGERVVEARYTTRRRAEGAADMLRRFNPRLRFEVEQMVEVGE